MFFLSCFSYIYIYLLFHSYPFFHRSSLFFLEYYLFHSIFVFIYCNYCTYALCSSWQTLILSGMYWLATLTVFVRVAILSSLLCCTLCPFLIYNHLTGRESWLHYFSCLLDGTWLLSFTMLWCYCDISSLSHCEVCKFAIYSSDVFFCLFFCLFVCFYGLFVVVFCGDGLREVVLFFILFWLFCVH